MRPRALIRWALAGLGLVLAVACVLQPEMTTVVLTLAPALVLLGLLVSGRYVGEERLERAALAVRRMRARRRLPARTLRPRAARPVAAPVARGGRLIAAALAVRPPPTPALRR